MTFEKVQIIVIQLNKNDMIEKGFVRKEFFALGHSALVMIAKDSPYAKKSGEYGQYSTTISKEGLLHKGLCSMSISEHEIKTKTFPVDYEQDIVKQFVEQLKSRHLMEFELIADPYISSI